MKITDVKTVVVSAEMRNWVFAKVETGVPGLFGWGEASLEWKTRSLVGTIEDMKQMVIGEDPRNIEHIYQKMYRQNFWRMGVIGMSAISAIEQGLWDIARKDLGVPVYRLLGGKVRDKVYSTTVRGRALGVAICTLWLADFAVTQTFPMMDENKWLVDNFRHAFPFYVYGFFCLVLIAVMKFIPETKGKSLEEIEGMWRKRERFPDK